MKVRNILLGAFVILAGVAVTAAESYKELYAKGVKEYKARKYAEAEKTLGELLKDENLTKKQKQNIYNKYIYSLYNQKKRKEVIALAEKAYVDENATSSMKLISAYLALRSLNELKKRKEMEAWAKKLQKISPEGTWNDRGRIYEAQALRYQKKYDEAEKLLNKKNISKMHPHRQGEALLERGRLMNAQKKYDDAIVEFTAVYELKKVHSSHKDQAVILIIESFNAAGELDDVDVWIKKIGTLKGKYWRTRGLLRHAQILQRQGKLKEAKAKWEECKKNGPWFKKEAGKQIAVINKKLEAK